MKKIIYFVAIFSLILSFTAKAEGEKQSFIIKNDQTVTVYQITDLGADNYGYQNARIEVSNFTNPTVSDLRVSEAPEEAWPMCSKSENGFYSSEVSKITKENKELKDEIEYLKEDKINLESNISWNKLIYFFLAVVIIIMTIFLFSQNKKIKYLGSRIN